MNIELENFLILIKSMNKEFMVSHLRRMEPGFMFVLMITFLVKTDNQLLQQVMVQNFGLFFWKKHLQKFMEVSKEL